MSHPALTISVFWSLTMVKITLLLAMAKICLLLIYVISLFPPLILPCILVVFLEFLLLHQILPLSIKSIIITIAGAILMKISFPFKLWPREKCFTRARVKVEFIPSILIKHHNFLCHLRSAIVLLGLLLLINLFGIWGLVILMIKYLKSFFLISNLEWISVILWSFLYTLLEW